MDGVPSGTVAGSSSPGGRGWSHLVSEEIEEMGWTAGLLRTMGERLGRSHNPEAGELGATLVRHAGSLLRLKEGALKRVLEVVEVASVRQVGEAEWQFVGNALRTCGEALVTAGKRYAESARTLPGMEGDLRAATGEVLIISRLVEERGSQMQRLGERLLGFTEADRMALSTTLVAKRAPRA